MSKAFAQYTASLSLKTKQKKALDNFQKCQECESTCCLEGMCMSCFTWTCEECGTACKNCGATVNE